MRYRAMIKRFRASLLVVSATGLFALAGFESGGAKPPLTAYDDGIGVQTICHGHTRGVTRGMRASPGQCEKWLREDVGAAGQAIAQLVQVPDHAAAIRRAGEPGVQYRRGKFGKSTLLRKINAGECQAAGREFLRWDRAGGKRMRGLTKRREWESKQWLSGCD